MELSTLGAQSGDGCEMKRSYPKYLAYVRTLPCCVCNKPGPSEPHHIKGVGGFSGAGLKAPDYASMPMCATCHREMHDHGEGRNAQAIYAIRTIGLAVEYGIIKL